MKLMISNIMDIWLLIILVNSYVYTQNVDKITCSVVDNRSGITCIYNNEYCTFFYTEYTQAKTLPKVGRFIDVYFYRNTTYLYDWFLNRPTYYTNAKNSENNYQIFGRRLKYPIRK